MKCCHTFSIKIVFTMCRGLLSSTIDVVKCRSNSLLSWLDIREHDRDKSVQALKLSRSTLKCHWRDSPVIQHTLQIAGATTYVLHVKQSCLLFIAEKKICWRCRRRRCRGFKQQMCDALWFLVLTLRGWAGLRKRIWEALSKNEAARLLTKTVERGQLILALLVSH